ncbi:polar amino acid transport system substrate-binding protein [Symbiobacterium terraclitae]|uniref:Polar amino acid transport system substrate-binding protein n=1 Tax=Symbiobacterium terraclitae TaxID=557451 RepID=A0ABS4JU50_9FIRM|nr:ABC transporter substrate-binding protein [Symbiobacterium terraclitae]MBP2019063.1 polar amino acid transport system substrate-binding protein [Symbiobacterium terraclitae]
MMRKSSAFLLVILLLAMTALTACGGVKPSDGGQSGSGTGTQQQSGGQTQQPSGGEDKKPANSLERIQAEGVLRVGIDASYPPMEFVDEDGKTPIGFDIDMAGAIAEKLGVKAEFVIIDWSGIQAGLLGGHYDAIMSSMTITEDRQKEMDFVQYITMGISYASRPGVEVKTDADLAGKVVVVQEETTAQYYIEDLMANQGIQPKELRSFPYATDAFRELANGMADVVAIDSPVAGYYAKLDPDLYRVTGAAEMEPDPIGIALRKGETELREAIQKAVDELKADGTLQQLAVKWFGDAAGQ